MNQPIEIGRLLRAGILGFVAGCNVSRPDLPEFGSLVRIPMDNKYQVFGLIYDIHIDEDGLVRQLVTSENVDEATIADSRHNRIVPLEMSVLAVGYEQDGKIKHLLPPRPPLSLDLIYMCDEQDIVRFTSAGKFGYFRHILRSEDIPVGEVLASHIQQTDKAQKANPKWKETAVQEIITLLRDDYPTLMSVLSALNEVIG